MNDLQQCILNIFKDVVPILERHKISYFGTDGTCLGAVRHGGFIPWDDDMDIAVPIEEYERMLNVLRRELPPHLEIYSPFEHTHFAHLIYKIIDRRTTYIEQNFYKYPDTWSGVWIDIIPLCGVPAPGLRRKIFYGRLWLNMFLNLYLREDYLGSHFTTIQRLVKKYIIKHRDVNYYLDKQLKLIQKHPTDRYDYVLESGFFKFANWTFKRSWFGKGKSWQFEDVEIKLPVDTDSYLTSEYGDYLQIPPSEKQVRHVGFVNLNRSYREYVENPDLYYREN